MRSLTAIAFAVACANGAAAGEHDTARQLVAGSFVGDHASLSRAPALTTRQAGHPLAIVLADDQSGSTLSTGVDHLRVAQVRHAVALVRRTGGRIALSRVTATSSEPFITARFQVLAESQLPPPDTVGTAFDRARALDQQSLNLAKVRLDSARLAAQADSIAADFVLRAANRIDEGAKAPRSAICALLGRAARFMSSEPDGPESQFIILETDGLDNVDPARCDSIQTAAVIVIVGPVEPPLHLAFPNLKYFENVDDALAFVERTNADGRG